METLKELALKLVDQLEEYYLRYSLLETMLDSANVPHWRRQFEQVFPFPPARQSPRRRFQPLRERIMSTLNMTTAVREMLNSIDP